MADLLSGTGYVRHDVAGTPMLSISTQDVAGQGIVFAGPVLSCTVQQSTDLSIHRIARSSFALSTFGANITTITLTGVQYIRSICSKRSSPTEGTYNNIVDFYQKFNIGDQYNVKGNPVLYIRTRHAGAADAEKRYKCVLVDMTRKLESTRDGQMHTQYTLTLIGVPYVV